MATKTKKKQTIKITGEGKYPLVPLESIEIVERPDEGRETEQLFFNPRNIDSFDPITMGVLVLSIRMDGLQQPPLVRAISEGGKITQIQLIAGERRFRSVNQIVEQDLPCYDEDVAPPKKYRPGATVIHKGRFAKVLTHKSSGVSIQLYDEMAVDLVEQTREDLPVAEVLPTVPGSKLYQNIPCRVAHDCSDERALRLAFTENDKAKSLKTSEEIALVERLKKMGLNQGEVADLLGSNETWVSQTLNFRDALPKAAFEKLVNGTMARHVAVAIMGYKPEERQELFEATVKAEEEDTNAKVEKLQDEQEQHEDEAELHLADQAKAEERGDTAAAKKSSRAAASSETKAAKAKSRREKAENERGTIKQSHVQKGAATTGVRPKKAKILPKEQIQQFYIDSLAGLEDGEAEDPECGATIPGEMVAMVRATASAILLGERDPIAVIRNVMIERGEWQVMASEDDTDDDVDEFEDEFEDDEYEPTESDFEDDDEEYDPVEELERMGYDDED